MRYLDNVIEDQEEKEKDFQVQLNEEVEKENAEKEEREAENNSTEPAVDRSKLTALELADLDAIYPKDIPFSRDQIRRGGSILYIISK